MHLYLFYVSFILLNDMYALISPYVFNYRVYKLGSLFMMGYC